MTSSVLNPVGYTVRKKQFRVAFIKFLLRASFQEAAEIDRRMFESRKMKNRQERGEQEHTEYRLERNCIVH